MLRDRYEPMNVLALVSAPGMELDPMLTQLDSLLDDDALFRAIKADLATRHPRTLRIDGTVVETNIHYPVDSTLLGDGVRVLSRTIRRAKRLIGGASGRPRSLFRDRSRSVRRVMQDLITTARRRGEQAQHQLQD